MPEITNKSEEQKVAEAEVESFRQDLGPFVVAAETTRMPMVFTDAKEPGHPIIFANDSFLSLTGYERKEVLGHSFNFLMARGADPKARAQVEAAFESSTDHGSEIRYRRLFETAQDAILILDAEKRRGTIMDANPFVIDLLGDQMKNLHVVDNLIRKRRSVGSYDRGVVLSGFTRRKLLCDVTLDGAGAFDWLWLRRVCRLVSPSGGH